MTATADLAGRERDRAEGEGRLIAVLRGSRSLFSKLPAGAIERFARGFRPVRLAAGAFLFLQDDPGSALYLVEAGRLRVFRVNAEGRERTLAYAGPGDILGEMAVLGNIQRSASVQAVETAHLWELDRRAFVSVIEHNPDVALGVLQILARRLLHADRMLEDAVGPVGQRLMLVLARLLQEAPAPAPGAARQRIEVTQQELAHLVGATRESVNRGLRRLEERGLVAGRRRGCLWVNRARLLAMLS